MDEVLIRQLSVMLSADNDEDLGVMKEVLAESFPHQKDKPLVTEGSLVDIVLKERLSWFNADHSTPDLIISIYSDLFRDLKVIADIKKIDRYQWLPIFVIVDEDITNTRSKFLQFGVTEVFSKPKSMEEFYAIGKQILKMVA
jgi:PleD family two-component response regulator